MSKSTRARKLNQDIATNATSRSAPPTLFYRIFKEVALLNKLKLLIF